MCNVHLIKRLTSATKSFFLRGFRFTRVSERKVSNLLWLSIVFPFRFLASFFPDPHIFQNLDEPSCFALFHRYLSCKFNTIIFFLYFCAYYFSLFHNITSLYILMPLTSILILSSKLCPSYFFFCCIFSDLENKIWIRVFERIIRIFCTYSFLCYKEARTDCPSA